MLNESSLCPAWTPNLNDIVAVLSTKPELGVTEWVSIVGAVITFFMAIATWRMASVAQKTLKAQNKPYVIVYAKQREDAPSVVLIIIENVGSSPAYDIQFTLPENFCLRAWDIDANSNMPAPLTSGPWVEGISQLVPKQKIIFYWGQYHGIKALLGGNIAKINVDFKDASGKSQPRTENLLDIKDFEGAPAATPVSVEQLSVIKKIAVTVEEQKNIICKKMEPRQNVDLYLWAYIAHRLGYPVEGICQVQDYACFSQTQIESIKAEAESLLRKRMPHLFESTKSENKV